jgi:hypothetical protein
VADRLPDVPHGYADAYSRLALARIAVDVLRGEREAVARAFRFTDDPSFRLAPTELAELRASADALTADVIRLVDSVRPDWGFPVLVAVARLVAVEATLRSGTLVVLDVYDSDTGDVTAAEIFGDGQIAASLLAEARADFARARSAFFSHEPPSEELRSRLEVEANRLLELERGWATGAALRPLPDPPVPSRGAALDSSLPLPAPAMRISTRHARVLERTCEPCERSWTASIVTTSSRATASPRSSKRSTLPWRAEAMPAPRRRHRCVPRASEPSAATSTRVRA